MEIIARQKAAWGPRVFGRKQKRGSKAYDYNSAPYAPSGPLTNAPAAELDLDLTPQGGFLTTGPIIVNDQTVVTTNGQLASARLDSAGLETIATLSPAPGTLLLGNGSSAWSASALSGDGTLSSGGALTVTNVSSTSGALAGYQYITTSTSLSANSPRVLQASNVVTITLPSTAVTGKEFLIQNLNTSGAVTMGGTISGSSSVSAGGCAIAVRRPDGKWQVHAF